jgi:urate oxidase
MQPRTITCLSYSAPMDTQLTAETNAVLSANVYGKSRIRLMRVLRHGDRHDLKEMTVSVRFEGDFESCFRTGDNGNILPTDTMKNTVYALAKDKSVKTAELFAQHLIDHFLNHNSQVSLVEIGIVEHLWKRIDGTAFEQDGGEKRTTTVRGRREGTRITSGIEDLVILKTTGSAFTGYIKDPLTTLPETTDRILATSLKADWRYAAPVPYDTIWHGIRRAIVSAFAEHQSLSVQHTLFAIGERVLETFGEVEEIHLTMPNKHCNLVDLSRFGLENDNEIFVPVDEPHGYIEAKLVRTTAS